MRRSSGGEILVDALERHGVELVFGIPGTHNLAAFAALADSGIRIVQPRHEQGAGYAADGYARFSGRPGVCLTTTGPAILNAAAAAAQAWSDSVPVLFISPGMPIGHPWLGNGELHEVKDQRAALESIVDRGHRVGSLEEIPSAVASAFHAMTAGRPRPVHLEIPLDLLEASAEVRAVDPLPSPRPRPARSEVDTAVEALSGARNPALVLGGGARAAGESVRALAERLAAPVVTTANGKGILDERHPLAVGAGLHQPSARALLEEADVVLAIGTELAPSDLWTGPLRPGGTLLRIDIDAHSIITNADPDVRLLGDAGECLAALLEALPHKRSADARAERAADTLAREAAEEGVDWRGLCAALREIADERTVIAGDSTMACYYGILSGVPVRRPAGFLYPTGMGTLGFGLPAAIGAKLAEPDSRVLAVLGDGGIMFTLPELATAAQLGLGIPVLVVDNQGYGEIRAEMLERGEPATAVTFGGTDFGTVARGLGCHAEEVVEIGELAEQLTSAFARSAPTLLHLRV